MVTVEFLFLYKLPGLALQNGGNENINEVFVIKQIWVRAYGFFFLIMKKN